MAEVVKCPGCGGEAKRDRRLLVDGRTPFICGFCRTVAALDPQQEPGWATGAGARDG